MWRQEPNSFVIGKSAPSNELIVRRKYFFVDVDPLRASGTPSTPEETAEAKRVRDNIVDYFLSIRHFERMILACSGSGYHILGEMDFDPDPAADSEQIKDQLDTLDRLFGNVRAEVDTGVYDPRRITRLYGTMNQKGREYGDRKHKKSCIESVVK